PATAWSLTQAIDPCPPIFPGASSGVRRRSRGIYRSDREIPHRPRHLRTITNHVSRSAHPAERRFDRSVTLIFNVPAFKAGEAGVPLGAFAHVPKEGISQ